MKHNFVELSEAELEEVAGGCFCCIIKKVTSTVTNIGRDVFNRVRGWFTC